MSDAVQAAIEARERRTRGEPELKPKKVKADKADDSAPFDLNEDGDGAEGE